MELELVHKCETDLAEDGTIALTWWWDGLPVVDHDGYHVWVNQNGQTVWDIPGAEDNAFGEPYTVMVQPNSDVTIGLRTVSPNQEFTETAVCETIETTPTGATELPFTGPTDFLAPLAMMLVVIGTWVVKLVR